MAGPADEARPARIDRTPITMIFYSTLNADSAGSASVSCNVVFVLDFIRLCFEEKYLELVVLSRCVEMAQVIFEDERAIGSSALRCIVDTLRGIRKEIQVIPIRKDCDSRVGCRRQSSFSVIPTATSQTKYLQNRSYMAWVRLIIHVRSLSRGIKTFSPSLRRN